MDSHHTATDRRPAAARRPLGVLALVLAVVCFGGVWGLWYLFVDTTWGQQRDDLAYVGAKIGGWRIADHAVTLLGTISVGAVAASIVVVATVALLRRRWLLALLAAGVVAACNLTTQLLKYVVFHRPDRVPWFDGPPGNTLPSGHTTAAGSAAVALVLVTSPRWRVPVALLGSGVMLAFGYATLVGQWHRPSDVLAGYLVCLGWALVAAALTAARRRRHPAPEAARRFGWLAWLMAALAVALVVAAAVLTCQHLPWMPPDDQSRSIRLRAYAGASLGFTGVCLGGMAVLAAVLNRVDARGRGATSRPR